MYEANYPETLGAAIIINGTDNFIHFPKLQITFSTRTMLSYYTQLPGYFRLCMEWFDHYYPNIQPPKSRYLTTKKRLGKRQCTRLSMKAKFQPGLVATQRVIFQYNFCISVNIIKVLLKWWLNALSGDGSSFLPNLMLYTVKY